MSAQGPPLRHRRVPRLAAPRRGGRNGDRSRRGRPVGLAAAPRPGGPRRTVPREREVLTLLVEGRSDRAIGAALSLGERTVGAHVRAVFDKLGLPPEPDGHHRVLAVLAYLGPAVRN
ncbi:helix-turn-helix transcriptional regulator [Rhodococcus aetherivorans]|uniref:response regulator transcription factor n=1 Tax=Rhodococcus aetherivorans TaxID=191292 RepID=UPI002E10A736